MILGVAVRARRPLGGGAERIELADGRAVVVKIGEQAALAAEDLDIALGHDDILLGLEADLSRKDEHRPLADVERLPGRGVGEQQHHQRRQ